MKSNNVIKVHTTSSGAELYISAPSVNQVISATNNKAQYFAELAKKYSEEAKSHKDNAKFYAEQNSDVTYEYIDNIRSIIEAQIDEKQDSGDYALREEIPNKLSELENDTLYVNETEFLDVVNEIKLPSQDGCAGKALVSDGENESWVDLQNLNKSQITNCLLEVPQNIKLELKDGVLTLKAGSKVIVPYGTEDKTADFPIGKVFYSSCDGRVCDRQYANGLFFLTIEIGQDLNMTDVNTSEQVYAMTLNDGGTLFTRILDNCVSGAGATTTFGYAYDTTANKISWYAANGSLAGEYVSFPICKASANLTSIDQVFNGMGYIGSTIWVDKGVKGLIPNGRNEDGSLRNKELLTDKVLTATATQPYWMILNTNGALRLHAVQNATPYINSSWWYDEQANIFYTQGSSGIIYNEVLFFATVEGSSSTGITSFQPKLPFRAVDYNEFNNIPHIVETYVNNYSWYRVWSDGWCEQGGTSAVFTTNPIEIALLKNFANTNYSLQFTPYGTNERGYAIAVSVKNTNNFSAKCCYTTNTGIGADAKGDCKVNWYACGY